MTPIENKQNGSYKLVLLNEESVWAGPLPMTLTEWARFLRIKGQKIKSLVPMKEI